MPLINIAVDGHSSCGKSTLARELAQALSYKYIDSGAMYRAIALYLIERDIAVENHALVKEALQHIRIDIDYPEGLFKIALNGTDVTERIKRMDVSAIVSEVATISAVRKKLVLIQQELGKTKGVVMDGRDIGTVVFPDAELKLFVTADLDTRAKRRFLELSEKGIESSMDEVRKNLEHRDHIDSTREDSPLVKATDAILIDNSLMSREEQLHLAKKLAAEVMDQ